MTRSKETKGTLGHGNVRKTDVEGGVAPPVTVEKEDPWAIKELVDNSPKWSELKPRDKAKRFGIGVAKAIGVLVLLYLFICSLDFLSSAFRLVGGRTTGQIFQQSGLLQNPVVGVMIGILVTVLVQSSSTSTSIVVSMVAADILTVSMAIPIVMGANIGTSVTNTIVSFTQMGNRDEFRRAFAAATVHDMFNWLTVIVLFVVEVVGRSTFGIGLLEFISQEITSGINSTCGPDCEIKLLNAITEPFTHTIIQLNKTVLDEWAKGNPDYENATLIRQTCSFDNGNGTYQGPCNFLLSKTNLGDGVIGGILLAIALALVCGCLIGIVKVLHSILKGQIANAVRRVINADIPYAPWLTGYLALLLGAVMTFLIQSSSVFTSALTPLVGVGIISIERVYPLTLGSNIGTTTTSLLAALATSSSRLRYTLQIALCHLFFNVIGIILFYPIPFMRLPITLAKILGETTAVYRWFSIVYLVTMFILLPGVVFGLSVAGDLVVYCTVVPFAIALLLIALINCLQRKAPRFLPAVLRNWNFLPLWMRSLEPLDRIFSKMPCCVKCLKEKEKPIDSVELEKWESIDSIVGTKPQTIKG